MDIGRALCVIRVEIGRTRAASSPGAHSRRGARLLDRGLLSRPALALYLVAVALLPWHSFPPFPWLHANAQWSDPSRIETSLVGTYGGLVPSADYARVQAGFPHPALLGSFCIFASAVVGLGEGALPRRVRVAAQLALALTVVVTFSRAILGFALAALVRTARTRRRRAAAVAIAVVSVGLIGILTFANLHLDPTSPLDTRIETEPEPDRRKELQSSIDSLLGHPLFGTGPGSLPGTSSLGQRQAHNTPVGVAATLGLPALLALIALVVALWRTRSRPTDRATWGGLAGLGVDGLGQDIEHFRHLWVMIGLAGAKPGARGRRDEPEGRSRR